MKTPGPRITNSPTSPLASCSSSGLIINISSPGKPTPAVVMVFSAGVLRKEVVNPPSVMPQRRVTKVLGNCFLACSINAVGTCAPPQRNQRIEDNFGCSSFQSASTKSLRNGVAAAVKTQSCSLIIFKDSSGFHTS